MFEKYLNVIIHDDKVRIYLIIGVIIYITCFSNLIPNKVKEMLRSPLFRMLALGVISYLSNVSFESAILFTLLYFSSTSCLKTENFDSDKLVVYNDDNPELNVIGGSRHFSNNNGLINLTGFDPVQDICPLKDDSFFNKTLGLIGNKTKEVTDNVTGKEYKNVYDRFKDSEKRCKTGFEEVSICAFDKNSEWKEEGDMIGEENDAAIKPCAAAYGKYIEKVCKYSDEEGNCYADEDKEKMVERREALLNKDLYEIKENQIKNLKNSVCNVNDNCDVKSFTIDEIKNNYLRNVKVPNKDSTFQLSDVKIDGEPIKVDNEFLYKVTLDGPLMNNSSNSNIPIIKLKSGYEYVYVYDEIYYNEKGEIYDDNNDQGKDKYAKVLIKIKGPVEERDQEGNITINTKTVNISNEYYYVENENVDVNNNNIIYEKKINPLFDNSVNNSISNPMYLKKDGTSTNNKNEADNAHHPLFQNRLNMQKNDFKRQDLYDFLNIKNDNRDNWEEKTARKIMRSIGCNRLKNNDNKDKVSYWNDKACAEI